MEDNPWKKPNDKSSLYIRIDSGIYKLLKTTNGDDFSGNILPDPKAGGAEGGSKGFLSRNLMKLVVNLGCYRLERLITKIAAVDIEGKIV